MCVFGILYLWYFVQDWRKQYNSKLINSLLLRNSMQDQCSIKMSIYKRATVYKYVNPKDHHNQSDPYDCPTPIHRTGTPKSSCTRRTYLCAFTGRSSKVVLVEISSDHLGIILYWTSHSLNVFRQAGMVSGYCPLYWYATPTFTSSRPVIVHRAWWDWSR